MYVGTKIKIKTQVILNYILTKIYGKENDIIFLLHKNDGYNNLYYNRNYFINSIRGKHTKIDSKYSIFNSSIGDYTYISRNSTIHDSTIGKFCSIGPNLMCGWGIHPTHGISTAPMFYSTEMQNGMTLSKINKIEEKRAISIGNDVFIGMNVIILDGMHIADGAIVGAGSVVTKDVPPYAVVTGNPSKIIRYRFDEEIRNKLLQMQWWNWSPDRLLDIEEYIFDVESFIKKHSSYENC